MVRLAYLQTVTNSISIIINFVSNGAKFGSHNKDTIYFMTIVQCEAEKCQEFKRKLYNSDSNLNHGTIFQKIIINSNVHSRIRSHLAILSCLEQKDQEDRLH